MKTHQRILPAARWLALALSAHTFALTALAQSPLADSFNPGADSVVRSLAVQADGKILVGGGFTTLGGQPRNHIARLNADGTLDLAFNPAANNNVNSLAVQSDGMILVGGNFTTFAGQACTNIARLNPDGTLDISFNPGANNLVNSLMVQANGKVLVGGAFTRLGGQAATNLARLNADGTLDAGFNSGANNTVNSLALQADGKILVGGNFTRVGGQAHTNIARLNANGAVDAAFNAAASGLVYSLAVQADGAILMSGSFITVNGQARTNLARLNGDGTLDTGFSPGADGIPLSLALQADGKILIGGRFGTVAGQTRKCLARLDAAGVLDAGFNPGAANYVYSLALQADGKILVGGTFTNLAGQTRNMIGRLNNTDAATQSLASDGSTITWLRGGATPEVWRATFDASTNGNDWTALGAGERAPGGWQLAGLAIPASAIIRARGFAAGGYLNASGWFVETTVGAPIFLSQPLSKTNNFGTSSIFTALALGPQPLGYQWLKDGVVLLDGGNITGTLTPFLSFSNVSGADAGGYTAVVSNESGSVTSAVARLAVIDPLITSQPVSQIAQLGQSVSLSVLAVGTSPLSYQWCKDGMALAEGITATVMLTNLQGSEAGTYTVVVSNQYGSVTSAVALLAINLATLDPGFSPGADSVVRSLAVQADGKILVGGQFYTLGGQNRNGFGRLKADGTLDTSFNPGADSEVDCLAVQADGKILVVGGFTTLGGQSRKNIGRLNADGTLDTSFNPGAGGATYPYVSSLALQADGKILVAGGFTTLGGQSRNYLGRLNADGTLDPSFNPGADGGVNSLALQADGKILVGGQFSTLDGQSRANIGRLNNTEPATQRLTFDGSTLTWMRGGTSPEVWRTTFEFSPNGGPVWTDLGAGSRIPGGWQLTGHALPTYSTFRARGYAVGGSDNASSWFVETIIGSHLRVVNSNSDGPGSLRQAILDANALPGVNSIDFAPSAYGTIALTSGELFITDDLLINGPGATNVVVDGNHASRVFHIGPGTTVTIAGLTIANARAFGVFPSNEGGGIYNDRASLTVSNCILSGNSADAAGGIFNDHGSLAIADSTLSSNSALAGSGGGILNHAEGGSATVTVMNSTLSGNSAIASGGGGIFNNGYQGRASVGIVNSTLSGNSAGIGGGIWNNGNSGSASVEIGSTILNASASGGNIFNDSGTVTSLGYNLSSDDGGGLLSGTGDQINTDPQLGPLQDNGGPTFTHAPACNSPAIDHGKNFSASATDQRGVGFARTFDGVIVPNAPGSDGTDVGAIELQKACDHPPVADASATVLLLISANGTNANVILDGSRSSDPDGDPLQYAWSEAGSPLASGVVAVTVLPVDAHSILLVVNDGLLMDTNAISVEVITTAQAVDQLVASVNSDVSRSAPLRATLSAAIASIDRSNPTAAINQLQAFQNQVSAQVAPLDAALAGTFIQAAQQAIDTLSSGNTNPGGHLQSRFTSLTRQLSKPARLHFTGAPGRLYIIEASTNLADWEMIGVAAGEPDGSFAFEDAQSARLPGRFYRIVAP